MIHADETKESKWKRMKERIWNLNLTTSRWTGTNEFERMTKVRKCEKHESYRLITNEEEQAIRCEWRMTEWFDDESISTVYDDFSAISFFNFSVGWPKQSKYSNVNSHNCCWFNDGSIATSAIVRLSFMRGNNFVWIVFLISPNNENAMDELYFASQCRILEIRVYPLTCEFWLIQIYRSQVGQSAAVLTIQYPYEFESMRIQVVTSILESSSSISLSKVLMSECAHQ